MINTDLASMTLEEKNSMIQSIDTVLHYMNGDKVSITVDDILEEKLPEDLMVALKSLNIGIAANGYLFDNDEEGFLSYLMGDMYSQRKIMKKEMITSQDEVEKIQNELTKRGIEYDD